MNIKAIIIKTTELLIYITCTKSHNVNLAPRTGLIRFKAQWFNLFYSLSQVTIPICLLYKSSMSNIGKQTANGSHCCLCLLFIEIELIKYLPPKYIKIKLNRKMPAKPRFYYWHNIFQTYLKRKKKNSKLQIDCDSFDIRGNVTNF